jgi:hypothetical protein
VEYILMDNLPHETMLEIISYVDVNSIEKLYITCKYFNFLSNYYYTTTITNAENDIVILRTDIHRIAYTRIHITDDYIGAIFGTTIIMVNTRDHIAQINDKVRRMYAKQATKNYNHLRAFLGRSVIPNLLKVINKKLSFDGSEIYLTMRKPYFRLNTILTENQDWLASPLHTAIAYRFNIIGYNCRISKFCSPEDATNYYPSIAILYAHYPDVGMLLYEHRLRSIK